MTPARTSEPAATRVATCTQISSPVHPISTHFHCTDAGKSRKGARKLLMSTVPGVVLLFGWWCCETARSSFLPPLASSFLGVLLCCPFSAVFAVSRCRMAVTTSTFLVKVHVGSLLFLLLLSSRGLLLLLLSGGGGRDGSSLGGEQDGVAGLHESVVGGGDVSLKKRAAKKMHEFRRSSQTSQSFLNSVTTLLSCEARVSKHRSREPRKRHYRTHTSPSHTWNSGNFLSCTGSLPSTLPSRCSRQ